MFKTLLKKRDTTLLFIIFSFALSFFSGACNSNDQVNIDNKKSIQEHVNSRIITFQDFKDDASGKLNSNAIDIINLKTKMLGGSKEANETYLTEINSLEKRNNDLKFNVGNYEDTSIANTMQFQKQFTNEMDSLDNDINTLRQ